MDAAQDVFRSSTSGWLLGTLAGWATIALAAAGVVGTLIGGYGAWPLLMSGAALAIIAAVWIRNMAARYDITEDRLIVRRGIFFKSIDEIELYRVKDVRLDFTLINQLAGIGTLCITSSDETTRGRTLKIRHVERAQLRREALRTRVEKNRARRLVREVDMVHDHDGMATSGL